MSVYFLVTAIILAIGIGIADLIMQDSIVAFGLSCCMVLTGINLFVYTLLNRKWE